MTETSEWQPIETAPHAQHFLATYFDDEVGEWIAAVIMRSNGNHLPWTHWQPIRLPAPPAPKGD